MRIEYLEEFAAIADTLSYSRIAKEHHTSVSALSKHIIAIEKELGIRLLDRNTTSVSLTPEGRSFYEDCLLVLEQYRRAIGNVQARSTKARKQLRIALGIRTVSLLKATTQAAAFLKEDQAISINYCLPDSDNHYDSLRESGIDAVITYATSGTPKEFQTVNLVKDKWIAVVVNSHPLASKKIISLTKDLTCHTITRLKGAYFRPGFEAISDTYEQYGVEPVSRFSMASSFDDLNLVPDFPDVLIIPSESLRLLAFFSPETHTALSFEEDLNFQLALVYSPKRASEGLNTFIAELTRRLGPQQNSSEPQP